MAPRQRKQTNRGLPPGLRVRAGYYSWRNPENGQELGIGRDRREAIKQAIAANAHLASKRITLVDRLAGVPRTWGSWCDTFEAILAERDLKPNTRRVRKSQLKRLRVAFDPGRPAAKITTADCAEVIDTIKKAGKHRSAQAFRSFLVDCFDRMIAKGWRGDNPARVLDEVSVKVKRARLSFDVFMALYGATTITRLKNAMALGLVSGQPRESVAAAEFKDFRDGGWWSQRGKTGARIMLPLDLRLDCFGMSLEDVLRQCRTTGVLSRYVIHDTDSGRGRRRGSKIHVDVLTREFTAELAKLGLSWADKEPPTYHEIRSLACRLYREQGGVNAQELLGHKDPKTTAIYADGREEWVRLRIPK